MWLISINCTFLYLLKEIDFRKWWNCYFCTFDIQTSENSKTINIFMHIYTHYMCEYVSICTENISILILLILIGNMTSTKENKWISKGYLVQKTKHYDYNNQDEDNGINKFIKNNSESHIYIFFFFFTYIVLSIGDWPYI